MKTIAVLGLLGTMSLTALGAAPEWTTGVEFYSPSAVRVTKYPGDAMPEKTSYSIIKTPGDVKVTATTDAKGNKVYMLVQIEQCTY